MKQHQQQPVSVIVYGGTTQQPTVVQTVTQPAAIPVRPQNVVRLPYLPSHKALGIIQMVAGVLCFTLEVIGYPVGYSYYFFSGIYSGIIFFITGLLGYLAFRKNNRCLIVACMVMNIIGSCVAVIALSFASVELSMRSNIYVRGASRSKWNYQLAKCIIVIIACIFEFVVTIVHASFTCASCCQCCWSRQTVYGQAQVTGSAVVQQVPQYNVNPGQMYQYQGHAPQQYPPQPYPTQQPMAGQQLPADYPQVVMQGAYPQHQGYVANAPSFSHDSPPGVAGDFPPPYSTVEEAKE